MGVEPTSKSISERLSPSAADRFCFAHPSPTQQTRGFAIPCILLRYREITQEVPACMTPDSRAAGDTGPTRGAELCSQCEIVVSFSVSFERVLFTWITATARLSLFHTPVETFTPPQVMKSGRTVRRSLIIFFISHLSICFRSFEDVLRIDNAAVKEFDNPVFHDVFESIVVMYLMAVT